MRFTRFVVLFNLAGSITLAQAPAPPAAAPTKPASATGYDWPNWRGPAQSGLSLETGLPKPEEWVSKESITWTADIRARGTPVVFGGRVYLFGYFGSGAALQECLVAFDAVSGQELWRRSFPDFMSDSIYERYGIGAPVVDPATHRIYLTTTPGLLMCFEQDGTMVWQVSLMETLGRLTFPNGRTGTSVIEGDLLITHMITSGWGADGPPRNRFFAFEKSTGRLVWGCTPGVAPKDSSFSAPVLADWEGQRVLYAGTGCGNIVAINAYSGEPIWRFQACVGGVNASPVLYTAPDGRQLLCAIHDGENLDSSEIGRVFAVRVPTGAEMDSLRRATTTQPVNGLAPRDGHPAEPHPGATGRPAALDPSRLAAASGPPSPALAGDRVYQTTKTGELMVIEAPTGRLLQTIKVGVDQLHAAPLVAEGVVYLPMWHNGLNALRITEAGAELVATLMLEGDLLGAPAISAGRMYVASTEKLYCFGSGTTGPAPQYPKLLPRPSPRPLAKIQPVPAEVLLAPGQTLGFTLNFLDQVGRPVMTAEPRKGAIRIFTPPSQPGAYAPPVREWMALAKAAEWAKFIPPTARVRSELDLELIPDQQVRVPSTAKPSAGMLRVSSGQISGTLRGRILPRIPFDIDFESTQLTERDEADPAPWSFPPLPWLGARGRWDIRDEPGLPEGQSNKLLAARLDRVILMRSFVILGHPEESGYTLSADVMTDGNRRNSSEVGLINQRYIIALKGNAQQLEVSSNHERLNVSVPFPFKIKTWYRLVTRVDVNDDGSGVVRAKAWPRGEPEPQAWTIEVPVPHAHRNGSPGLYSLTPQVQFKVFVDNISARKSVPLPTP